MGYEIGRAVELRRLSRGLDTGRRETRRRAQRQTIFAAPFDIAYPVNCPHCEGVGCIECEGSGRYEDTHWG